MPQISKRKLDEKIKKDLLDSFSYIIKELKTKGEVDEFLSSSLTDTERLMLSKRVVTAYLLRNKVEEIKIGRALKLTPATITRMKMLINLKPIGFDLAFNKLDKKSKEDITKQILLKLLDYTIKVSFGKVPKPF